MSVPPPSDRRIEASWLREILTEPSTAQDPRGLTVVGAVIVGDLDLRFVTLDAPLELGRCVVTGSLDITGAQLRAFDLMGSEIHGVSPEGYSIRADGAHIDRLLVLNDLRLAGAICLRDMSVGSLLMKDMVLSGYDKDGDSLYGDGIQVGGDVSGDGLKTVGSVRLAGGHVRGDLSLSGAKLRSTDAPIALMAQTLQVDQNVTLAGIEVSGGGVSLAGAHIGGYLNMRGAQLLGIDEDGDSLVAHGLHVDQNAFLDRAKDTDPCFVASGAIGLTGAHVSGSLKMGSACLKRANVKGECLRADQLTVGQDVIVDDLTATGALRFVGSHIGGMLSMRNICITPVIAGIDASGISVGRELVMEPAGARTVLSLAGCRVGTLSLPATPDRVPELKNATGWRLDDVSGWIRTDRRAAARWLDDQPGSQPWRELADVYDRNGQSSDAKWLRYQAAVRSTRGSAGWGRLARNAYRWTTGHGYYPLVAVVWIAVILGAATGLAQAQRGSFTTATTQQIGADLNTRRVSLGLSESGLLPGRVPADWCASTWDVPCFGPVGYAAATVLPVSVGSSYWDPPEGWVRATFVVLRLLTWAFTAVLAAGVTGLLRKQT